jgi:hypothetical protein
MHKGNPGPESYGILPNHIGDSTDLGWDVVDLDPYVLVQSGRVGVPLAAIGRDAPIKDVPVTLRSPFDFSQTTLESLQNRFLWDKLMFDPRLLLRNPFFSSDSNLTVRPNLFGPAPMNPVEGVPILPPQFR